MLAGLAGLAMLGGALAASKKSLLKIAVDGPHQGQGEDWQLLVEEAGYDDILGLSIGEHRSEWVWYKPSPPPLIVVGLHVGEGGNDEEAIRQMQNAAEAHAVVER
jgi:hypothetical protein